MMSMNVSEAIRTKRAVRQFQDKPLPEQAMLSILNAGRRAQSAKNMQPWHFIAITDKTILKQLSECGEWAGHLAGAALTGDYLSDREGARDSGLSPRS